MESTGVRPHRPHYPFQSANDRSPGLEEYIEGLSFLHYLEHGNLITLEEVQSTLSDTENGEPVS